LENLFAGRNIDLQAIRTRLKMTADELNLPLGERNITYNSRRATELGKWAEALGKGDTYHNDVFRAYFADSLNIADVEILKDICRKIGLDPTETEKILAKRTYKKAVDDDWEYALRIGISSVPTFLANGRMVVGAQPYGILEKLVTREIL